MPFLYPLFIQSCRGIPGTQLDAVFSVMQHYLEQIAHLID